MLELIRQAWLVDVYFHDQPTPTAVLQGMVVAPPRDHRTTAQAWRTYEDLGSLRKIRLPAPVRQVIAGTEVAPYDLRPPLHTSQRKLYESLFQQIRESLELFAHMF